MSTLQKRQSCKDLVYKKYVGRLVDLHAASDYFSIEKDSARAAHNSHDDLKHFDDYYDYVNQLGLSFDYVPANLSTFPACGYWRWQLSYGGPSDEFRVFTDIYKNIDRVEYAYLDWFDAASHEIRDIPAALRDALEWFLEFSSYDQEGREI